MGTYKDKLVEKYMSEPIKVGDTVNFSGEGNGSQNPEHLASTEVLRIEGDTLILKGRSWQSEIKRKLSEVTKYDFYIGYDPFPEKPWNSSLRVINYGLDSIIGVLGYDRRRTTFNTELHGDVEVSELDWNPFVIGKDGKLIHYQRGFVWSLKEKQLLIDSIYNNIDIGKIVIRKRSWNWVESRVNQGLQACHKDIVDGKQRISTILDFIQDKFVDSDGKYFSDLSEKAKFKFFDFHAVAYGELGENATDQDVLDVFLGVNFTGVPMSAEHIDFVKNIKI